MSHRQVINAASVGALSLGRLIFRLHHIGCPEATLDQFVVIDFPLGAMPKLLVLLISYGRYVDNSRKSHVLQVGLIYRVCLELNSKDVADYDSSISPSLRTRLLTVKKPSEHQPPHLHPQTSSPQRGRPRRQRTGPQPQLPGSRRSSSHWRGWPPRETWGQQGP